MRQFLCSYRFQLSAFVLSVLLLASACEKPTDELGFSQVIGNTIDADSLHLPIITYTREIDSVLVALSYRDQLQIGGYNPERLLGYSQSPIFGTEEARLLSQLLPTQVNQDFGANPQVDSVYLYLRMTEAYGDTSQPMDIIVHELDQSFKRDTLYFSNYRPALAAELGRLEGYFPRPRSGVQIEGQPAPASLRIPLSVDFFQQRFADIGNGQASEFSSFANFLDYFKGIQVEARAGGCMLYLNLASSFSRLRIYYHNDQDTSFSDLDFAQDKSTVPIILSAFDQDYQNSEIGSREVDSLQGEAITYVQALGGVATAIKLDPRRVDSLAEEGLVINRAFLELYTAVGTGEATPPPTRLELRLLEGKSLGSRIVDFSGQTGGDGQLQPSALRLNFYRFDITRHLFRTLNQGENPTLAAVPTSRTSAANRSVLRGGKSGSERAKIIVYYTKP